MDSINTIYLIYYILIDLLILNKLYCFYLILNLIYIAVIVMNCINNIYLF